ncbi:ribonucleotide-diphosphate reductase subunit beta, partial [Acinetobacter baumannii]|nr:ribonucleotide-diphosphate reductase subunit beta [Acinetobacter baumannii]
NNINQNIAKHVTSPEVSMCLSRQAWEEALHVKSYATIIETVSLDPMSVYMTFERDGLLAQKNQFILKQSRLLGEKFSAEGFALSCVSN